MRDADVSLPALVRALRQQALLSQEELADRSGLSIGTIRGLEAGRIRKPRGASVRQLAKVLAPTEVDRERLLAAAQGDAGAVSATAVGAPPARRPAQLPLPAAGFAGRGAELGRLDDIAARSDGVHPLVITVAGTAGVGKTALAVHWAHRVADRFPDGQLYVNLRGYDPDQPMTSADALARFLTALGVAGQNIPLDLDERAARFRSELAGRRMLIVLDNAASVAQVRPLLPGAGSCLVLVTSRDSLAGLVAVHGAQRIDLDLLPAGEAIGLLRQLIGARIDHEPQAAAKLVEQCVRLPLALRVAAELAASRPDDPLAELVAELADRQARLDLLDAGGDPYAAVREVFSWSIQHLPDTTARTFRRLGLHPGPDLDPYAAAALADTDLGHARRTLGLLARAHLVHRTSRGRYGMHDLLRAYAIGLATTEESDRQRETAEQRLFDYYQAAAVSAMDTLHPAEAHHRPEAAASATPLPGLAEPDAARAWLEAERFCLVALAAHTAASGRSDHVVGLSRLLHRYLGDAHLTEMLVINEYALRATEQAGDLSGQGHALRALGLAHTRLSRYDTAMEHSRQAVIRFERAGDLPGLALALTNLGVASYRRGDHEHAIDAHQRSIELARRAGDRLSEAAALTNLGVVMERVGRYAEAADHQRLATAIFTERGARYCEGLALSNLANVELRLGHYPSAADHLRRSLACLQRLGSPITEAHTWDTLGILHLRLGEPERATPCFQKAHTLYRDTGERSGQAWALNGLGEAAQLADRPADALTYHTDALAITVDSDVRHQQARAHTGLGHAHWTLGDGDRARSHYEQAYTIYTDLGMPDAEDIAAYLALRTRTRRYEETAAGS